MWRLLLLFTAGLWLVSCQPNNKSEKASSSLCACVQGKTPEGTWDMHLSEDCIQLCLKTFGPELKGMEDWFKLHCGLELKHPEVKEKSKEVDI
ncbi:MAG: hypothetical protein MRZ79_24085 [Bacteroidia bacterium]|nr:hypothetical protein [Bacteroidia bacterium]